MQTQKRLVRLDDEKMIAGVASGIGRYLGIDPFVIRLGFVAASFLGGAGLVLYIVAALILPRESNGVVSEQPTQGSELVRWFLRQRTWVKVALVVVLFLVIGGFANAHGLFVWGAALLVIGAFLLLRSDEPAPSATATAASEPEPTPSTAATTTTGQWPTAQQPAAQQSTAQQSAAQQPTAQWSATQQSTAQWSAAQPTIETPLTTAAYGNPSPPQSSPAEPAKPRYVRNSDALPVIGTGVAFFVAAALLVLGHHDVINLSVQHFLAAIVIVLGATVFVGAWIGRARILTGLALTLVFFTAVSSVAGVHLDNGTGLSDNRPTTIAALQQDYSFGAGREILDLSSLPADDAASPVRITLSAGDLVIVVPRNRPVAVDARVGFGHIDALGQQRSGVQKKLSATHDAFDPYTTTSTLVVEAHNGFGRILVTDDPDSKEFSRR
jgi:phage shock protein PspC (stress-responsive transcriptional regulator)